MSKPIRTVGQRAPKPQPTPPLKPLTPDFSTPHTGAQMLASHQANSPVVSDAPGGTFNFTMQKGLRALDGSGPALSYGSIGEIPEPEPGHPDNPSEYEPLHHLTIKDVARAGKK